MSYAERWRAYRFWNRLGLVALFAVLPIVGFGAWMAEQAGDIAALPYLLVLIWLLALWGMLYRIRTFRCPRCGKTFSVHGWLSPQARDSKCVHCALELDT